MGKYVRNISVVVAVLVSAKFFTACGESEEVGLDDDQSVNADGITDADGDDDSEGDTEGNDDGDGSTDDCLEGQSLNPFTGECRDEVVSDGDGGSGDECEPGAFLNPVTGTCESDEEICEPGEVFDQETQACVGDTPLDCELGSIVGQACAPSGQFLASATITVAGLNCDGEPFTMDTTADGQGNYSFNDVPPGAHELLVTSGSFAGERTIQVTPGQELNLSGEAEKVCVTAENVNIMVFQGTNESMTTLLDNLEIEYDSIASSGASTANLLMDLPALFEYDILFFECNHLFSTVMSAGNATQIISNLQSFVQAGGSLYAADNSYQWVAEPFPNLATFGGTATSEIVMADVISTDMLNLLGASEVEIDFDLGGMRVIDSIEPPTVLHLSGTRGGENGRPLMYTYRDPINGGTVIYTSFHSSAQGTASEEILDILNFLIFQL